MLHGSMYVRHVPEGVLVLCHEQFGCHLLGPMCLLSELLTFRLCCNEELSKVQLEAFEDFLWEFFSSESWVNFTTLILRL